MTFTPLDRPLYAVVSDVKQSDSSNKPRQQRGSVTIIATIIDEKIKPNKNARTNTSGPPPTGKYVFNIQFDDGLPGVISFFCKATYCIKTSIGVTSNACLTTSSLLNTGTSLILISKAFISQASENSIN